MTPAVVTPKWEPLLVARGESALGSAAYLQAVAIWMKLDALGSRPTKLTVLVKGEEVKL